MGRQQHAVSKHVTRHVSHPRHSELVTLGVHPHLPEMALDTFPRASRGDAHGLVVITHAATGGKCIAQPVAVLLAHRIGMVRERGCPFVGGYHQVRVIAIHAHHVRRGNCLAGH